MGNKVRITGSTVYELIDWVFDRTMQAGGIADGFKYTEFYNTLMEGVQATLLTLAENPEEVEAIIRAERIW